MSDGTEPRTVNKHAWRDEHHPGCVVLRISDRPGETEYVLPEQRARTIYSDLRALLEAEEESGVDMELTEADMEFVGLDGSPLTAPQPEPEEGEPSVKHIAQWIREHAEEVGDLRRALAVYFGDYATPADEDAGPSLQERIEALEKRVDELEGHTLGIVTVGVRAESSWPAEITSPPLKPGTPEPDSEEHGRLDVFRNDGKHLFSLPPRPSTYEPDSEPEPERDEGGEDHRALLARRMEEWAKADRIPPPGLLREVAAALRSRPSEEADVLDRARNIVLDLPDEVLGKADRGTVAGVLFDVTRSLRTKEGEDG